MTDNQINNAGGPSQVFLENKEGPMLRIQADSGRTAPLERSGAVNTASEYVNPALLSNFPLESYNAIRQQYPTSLLDAIDWHSAGSIHSVFRTVANENAAMGILTGFISWHSYAVESYNAIGQ
ncbi:hypothetical protein M404DRAFT_1005350 [Pisolithus tinctorius Marx 270]|uniref:Uncharacterized protein n=1 Tax=Pisolithus tinctorius Marx 270 TaxID=870435 RepID=A0A0C3JLD5_PISTI|nr:hypothetical protein M404DRAFT_1005350 [Pisolithus tinctorius Marx 270]